VLLTDFGLRDSYAASIKGVILSLFPRAVIVDLSHEVEPQNLFQAAFLLEATYPYFPAGSVFVTVVDPGVGSERRILAARTPHGIFLAPDNGILAGVLAKEKQFELRVVTNRKFFLPSVSHTFHGRDCFAPVAARLAKNPSLFSRLGPPVHKFTRLHFASPHEEGGRVFGEILYFDHFGNAFANISKDSMRGIRKKGGTQVRVKGKRIGVIRNSYYQGRKGEAIAVFSSSNLLEIAVNQGSAREKLKLREGVPVEVF